MAGNAVAGHAATIAAEEKLKRIYPHPAVKLPLPAVTELPYSQPDRHKRKETERRFE
jgi:hypothetical protein